MAATRGKNTAPRRGRAARQSSNDSPDHVTHSRRAVCLTPASGCCVGTHRVRFTMQPRPRLPSRTHRWAVVALQLMCPARPPWHRHWTTLWPLREQTWRCCDCYGCGWPKHGTSRPGTRARPARLAPCLPCGACACACGDQLRHTGGVGMHAAVGCSEAASRRAATHTWSALSRAEAGLRNRQRHGERAERARATEARRQTPQAAPSIAW